MIRRPPRSTLDRSSAASDVYKRQALTLGKANGFPGFADLGDYENGDFEHTFAEQEVLPLSKKAVSYTHLRAHETVLDLVCRLLLAKKQEYRSNIS